MKIAIIEIYVLYINFIHSILL
jgi:hypothetical protein